MTDSVWFVALLGLLGNLIANLITAAILYVVIERQRTKREDMLRAERDARERRDRLHDNHNIVNTLLLAQFPPLIGQLHTVQREAFTAATLSYQSDTDVHPYIIASEARHFANVHMNVKGAFDCMGMVSERITNVARFVNSVAHLALHLARGETPPALVWRSLEKYLKALGQDYGDEFLGSSHRERIDLLIAQVLDQYDDYQARSNKDKIQFLCWICEAIAHATVLATDSVLREFKRHISAIDIAERSGAA